AEMGTVEIAVTAPQLAPRGFIAGQGSADRGRVHAVPLCTGCAAAARGRSDCAQRRMRVMCAREGKANGPVTPHAVPEFGFARDRHTESLDRTGHRLADPRFDPDQRGQRRHAQGFRLELKFLAGSPVGALWRGVPLRRRLRAAGGRTRAHRRAGAALFARVARLARLGRAAAVRAAAVRADGRRGRGSLLALLSVGRTVVQRGRRRALAGQSLYSARIRAARPAGCFRVDQARRIPARPAGTSVADGRGPAGILRRGAGRESDFVSWLTANLAPLMFAGLVLFLFTGVPVAFALVACGLSFAAIGIWLGVFPPELLGALPLRVFGIVSSELLLAIPFFTFMGLVLQRSGMAEDLLETIGQVFGPVRGGLSLAVIFVGALLGATTGVVAASVISMGLISLPVMLRNGYNPAAACGVIAASGTLALVVPPSLVLIVVAVLLGTSVGDLYAGALVPAALVIGLYAAMVAAFAVFRPRWMPAMPLQARTFT